MSKLIIKVGISSCLLGEKVRHDGGHKRKAFITDLLGQYFQFEPTCPEVGIGLGVPRPTIRLINEPKSPRLVFVKDHTKDLTSKMEHYSDGRVKSLEALCGYIFKKGSPTCGPDVKVYQETPKPPKMGKGVFYRIFCETYPLIPVEDEGRLNDPSLRENFVERVYLMHRWRVMAKEGVSSHKLIDFHAKHKLALMAHNVSAYRRLGQMIANIDKKRITDFSAEYIFELMSAFKCVATNKKVTNVLQHCQGYLKKYINAKDKAELNEVIDKYRLSQLPLIVPVTLLKHHFMHFPNDYMSQQSFLNPYADELMLRNKI